MPDADLGRTVKEAERQAHARCSTTVILRRGGGNQQASHHRNMGATAPKPRVTPDLEACLIYVSSPAPVSFPDPSFSG